MQTVVDVNLDSVKDMVKNKRWLHHGSLAAHCANRALGMRKNQPKGIVQWELVEASAEQHYKKMLKTRGKKFTTVHKDYLEDVLNDVFDALIND